MHWSLGLEASTNIATMKMWSVAHKMVKSGVRDDLSWTAHGVRPVEGVAWDIISGFLFYYLILFCLIILLCFHRVGSRRVGIV